MTSRSRLKASIAICSRPEPRSVRKNLSALSDALPTMSAHGLHNSGIFVYELELTERNSNSSWPRRSRVSRWPPSEPRTTMLECLELSQRTPWSWSSSFVLVALIVVVIVGIAVVVDTVDLEMTSRSRLKAAIAICSRPKPSSVRKSLSALSDALPTMSAHGDMNSKDAVR